MICSEGLEELVFRFEDALERRRPVLVRFWPADGLPPAILGPSALILVRVFIVGGARAGNVVFLWFVRATALPKQPKTVTRSLLTQLHLIRASGESEPDHQPHMTEVPEIISLIVSGLEKKRDMASAALVNRTFSAQAQPLIWRHLALTSWVQVVRCCRSVQAHRSIAAFPRTLSIFIQLGRRGRELSGAYVLLSRTLRMMSRLVEMDIGYYGLERQSWVLPLDVPFALTSFAVEVDWDDHLTSFLISQPSITVFQRYSRTPTLPSFNPTEIFLPNLHKFVGNPNTVLQLSGPFRGVHSLHLSCEWLSSSYLALLADACPQLCTLKVRYNHPADLVRFVHVIYSHHKT